MTKQEYIERVRELFPHENPDRAVAWAGWLENQGVPFESMYSAFYGVHQQYGGELAGLLYLKGPSYYCLHPNEFTLAAEYLSDGGPLEQIDERPSLAGPERQGHSMSMCQGGPH